MEAGLNSGPPRLLDGAVRALLPPMVREQVSGDLWERYRSPTRYLADTVAVLPYLIASQVRRAGNGALIALQAFTLLASFGGFEPTPAPASVTMLQRALIAAVAAIAALLLRTAYRTSDQWTGRRALGDLVAMLAAVLAIEGLLGWLGSLGLIEPHWRIGGPFLVGGLVFSAVIVFVLRSGIELAPRATPIVPEAVELDYQRFRRNLRFKYAAEIGTLSVLLALVLLFSLNARIPLVAKVGFAWLAIAGPATLYIAWQAHALPRRVSEDRDARLALYRGELVRQRDEIGLAWWLCFGPLFAGLGLNMIVRGAMKGWPVLALSGVACIAALTCLIMLAKRARTRQLSAKIAVLDKLERQQSGRTGRT